jgi:toxin ParE1/3/4
MTPYVVSPRAQRDIEEIWNYTTEQWSSAQAERYIRSIQEAIETISADICSAYLVGTGLSPR